MSDCIIHLIDYLYLSGLAAWRGVIYTEQLFTKNAPEDQFLWCIIYDVSIELVGGEEGTRHRVFQIIALERAAKNLTLVVENEMHVGKGVIAFIIRLHLISRDDVTRCSGSQSQSEIFVLHLRGINSTVHIRYKVTDSHDAGFALRIKVKQVGGLIVAAMIAVDGVRHRGGCVGIQQMSRANHLHRASIKGVPHHSSRQVNVAAKRLTDIAAHLAARIGDKFIKRRR